MNEKRNLTDGERRKHQRKAIGLSQGDFADIAELSLRTVQILEAKAPKQNITPKALAKYTVGLLEARRGMKTKRNRSRSKPVLSTFSIDGRLSLDSAGCPKNETDAELILTAFRKTLPDDLFFLDWHKYEFALPMASVALHYASVFDFASRTAAETFYWFGRLSAELGKYLLSHECHATCVEICHRAPNCDDLLGNAYRCAGSTVVYTTKDADYAVEQFVMAATMRGYLDGAHDILVAQTLLDWGVSECRRGNVQIGIDLVKQAIEILKIDYEDHPEYAWAHRTLAECLRLAGDLHSSLAILDKAISFKLGLHKWDPEHPQMGYHYLDRAITLFELGDRKSAVNDAEKALEVRQPLGEAHPMIALVKGKLGKFYLSTGRIKCGRKYLGQCIDIQLKYISPNDRELLEMRELLRT